MESENPERNSMFRPHQQECIEKIYNFKKEGGRRATIKMFCGTGKTRILLYVASEMFHQNLSIIVFPTLSLISQFRNDYLNNEKFADWIRDKNFSDYLYEEEKDKKIKMQVLSEKEEIINFLKATEELSSRLHINLSQN